MNNSPARISVVEKLGFGIGELGNNLYWQFFMYYLLYFYTDIYKIAPGVNAAVVAGQMFFVVRFFDAIFDVLIGLIADRTKSRWGKYRPYLLFGALPFGLAGVLAFITPNFDASGKIVYAYITYTFLMMVYSAVAIPQNSLLGVITPDSLERTSFSKYKFIFAFIAGMIVQKGTPFLVKQWGQGDEARGYQMALFCYAVIAVVCFLLCFFAIRERVSPPAAQKTNLKDDFHDVLTNVPWLVLCVATLASILCIAIRSQTFIYYFKYFVRDHDVNTVLWGMQHFTADELLANFLILGTISTIGGTCLVPYFSRLMGKKFLYFFLMLSSSIVTAAYYFIRPDQIGLIFLLQILAGLTLGPTSAVLWAMYADCADFSEWTHYRRATALVFSAAIMAQKFGWMFGGYIPGRMLTSFGYSADKALSDHTLHGILLMNTLIPAGFGVLAGVIMLFYGLSESKMKQIEGDLIERRKTVGQTPAVA